APQTPFGHTIFCDDIRREINGKTTLVGVYSDDILLNAPLPVMLPKLACSIIFYERPYESRDPLSVRLWLPEEPTPFVDQVVDPETLQEFRSPASYDAAANADPIFRLTIYFDIYPVLISNQGWLKTSVVRGDTEIRVGSIRVKAGTPIAS